MPFDSHLRNKFDFLNVHGITNTSGLLQSKYLGFMLTLQETQGIRDSMNIQKIEFIAYIYFYIIDIYDIELIIRGSCMVWEINMGVCPRLDFDNIMLSNCLWYNFNIYGAFEFLCNSIAN